MSDLKTVDEILQNVERLPTMPKAVMEIIRCIDDQNTGVEEVARTISLDMA
jgi:HD-like signal output (HDOD) protein